MTHINTGLAVFSKLTLLSLMLLITLFCAPGCASPAKQPEKAPAAQRSEKAASATDKAAKGTGKTNTQKATAGKATAQKNAAARQSSAADRMLQSAGRNATASQPEQGFVLNVPESVGDGEAFLVEFGAEGARNVTLGWRGKTLGLGSCEGGEKVCRALLSVPLDEKVKSLPLTMTVAWANGKTEKFSANLSVSRRKYPVQKLKVASKFVSPPPAMQEKIKRDRAEFNAAISKITPTRYWNTPFLRPVPGEVTSLFGLRRVFNNVPKNPHKGVDFNAKQGDPIAAIEGGVVTLVSDHYYSGQVVIIDHGLGVHSVYMHMSGFNVTKGQKVSRGDTIGYIGSTGRVTGPHLHLSLMVLGVGVNAATCIAM